MTWNLLPPTLPISGPYQGQNYDPVTRCIKAALGDHRTRGARGAAIAGLSGGQEQLEEEQLEEEHRLTGDHAIAGDHDVRYGRLSAERADGR